jgi:hypothetical protein
LTLEVAEVRDALNRLSFSCASLLNSRARLSVLHFIFTVPVRALLYDASR